MSPTNNKFITARQRRHLISAADQGAFDGTPARRVEFMQEVAEDIGVKLSASDAIRLGELADWQRVDEWQPTTTRRTR